MPMSWVMPYPEGGPLAVHPDVPAGATSGGEQSRLPHRPRFFFCLPTKRQSEQPCSGRLFVVLVDAFQPPVTAIHRVRPPVAVLVPY